MKTILFVCLFLVPSLPTAQPLYGVGEVRRERALRLLPAGFDRITSNTGADFIHEEQTGDALLTPKADADKDALDRRIAQMQMQLGDSYRARLDEHRKIAVLSDLPDSAVDGYLDTVRRYEDVLHDTFFEHLPDYWIMVII